MKIIEEIPSSKAIKLYGDSICFNDINVKLILLETILALFLNFKINYEEIFLILIQHKMFQYMFTHSVVACTVKCMN